MSWSVLTGDVSEILPELEPESFDSVLCDPPYGLSFMGKEWDHGVPSAEVWEKVCRALKPGGHLIAFGGTRTFHRLTCAIEDAGFEIRDCLCWLYGQGFPKSLDVSKALDKLRHGGRDEVYRVTAWMRERCAELGLTGRDLDRAAGVASMSSHWLTDKSQPEVPTLEQWAKLEPLLGPAPEWMVPLLKPANEPGEAWQRAEVVGVAGDLPGLGGERFTSRDNLLRAPETDSAKLWQGYGTALKPAWEPAILAMKPCAGTFAENALAHGVAGLNVYGCRLGVPPPEVTKPNGGASSFGRINDDGWKPTRSEFPPHPLGRWPANVALDEEAAAMLDEQSGELKAGVAVKRNTPVGKVTGHIYPRGNTGVDATYGDFGGASRFFYVAKASRSEREAGLDGLRTRFMATMGDGIGAREHNEAQPSTHVRNHHPTVKPLALCEWLAKLLLPPKRDTPRRLLVPFSGSGSEMIGALRAGWDEVVGIEREAEYVQIAEARLAHWAGASNVLPFERREQPCSPRSKDSSAASASGPSSQLSLFCGS